MAVGDLPAETTPESKNEPVLEISEDTVLDPNWAYGRIVITKSNVTLNGRGALRQIHRLRFRYQ